MKGLDIHLLEGNISKKYLEKDIREISKDGIIVGDYEIKFKRCTEEFCYSYERGIGEREYVGARNSLTEPPYIKLHLDDEDIFILFANGDGLFACAESIRAQGYDTFDLS